MAEHIVQVRRPKAIVFDILGTASKSGFLEKILFPYLKINLDNYVNTNWHSPEFMHIYKQIVQQSNEFKLQEPSTPVVVPHEDANAKITLMKFIDFVSDNNINAPSVTRLRFKVWFQGYQQSKIRTPIYSDVPNRIKRWFSEGIKFHVFSNTWTEAQKALLRNTNHGDLTNLISGHFDNDFGSLTEPDSWRRLCMQIGEAPQDVLFLTKAPIEGRAAAEAGLGVVLVLTHRHNVRAVSREDRIRFPYVRTLNELAWLEEQQQPAIVPPLTSPSTSAARRAAGLAQPPPPPSLFPQEGGSSSGVPPSTNAPPTSSTATTTGQSGAVASSSTSRQRSRTNSRVNGPMASSSGAAAAVSSSSAAGVPSASGAANAKPLSKSRSTSKQQ